MPVNVRDEAREAEHASLAERAAEHRAQAAVHETAGEKTPAPEMTAFVKILSVAAYSTARAVRCFHVTGKVG